MSEILRLTPADINRLIAARTKAAPRKTFATMAEYEEWKAAQ